MTATYCDHCRTPMALRSARGLQRELIAGIPFDIPEQFKVWRCATCSEFAIDAETAAKIDKDLAPKVREWKLRELGELLTRMRAQHPTFSQWKLGEVLDVTPEYLSNCLAGKKEPSMSLVRFVQALVACPAEYERHRSGRPKLPASVMAPALLEQAQRPTTNRSAEIPSVAFRPRTRVESSRVSNG